MVDRQEVGLHGSAGGLRLRQVISLAVHPLDDRQHDPEQRERRQDNQQGAEDRNDLGRKLNIRGHLSAPDYR